MQELRRQEAIKQNPRLAQLVARVQRLSIAHARFWVALIALYLLRLLAEAMGWLP